MLVEVTRIARLLFPSGFYIKIYLSRRGVLLICTKTGAW